MKKLICIMLTLCVLLALGVSAAYADGEALTSEEILGTKKDNVYENTLLGIRAEFPKGWRILSDEETMSMMGAGLEMLDDEKLNEIMDQNTALISLYAMAGDNSGDNVNVMVQSLNALQRAVLTEETIANENAKNLKSTFANSGMDIQEIEQGTVDFAGASHPAIDVRFEMMGVTCYERLVLIKSGNYFGTITSFSLDESRAASILEFFKEL